MAQYWLLDWLDEQALSSMADIDRVLAGPGGRSRLIERALAEANRRAVGIPAASGQAVAGPSMDLSGHLTCASPRCLIRGAQRELTQALMYFDRVVVTGLDPVDLHEAVALDENGDGMVDLVRRHASVALEVRRLGLEDVLLFSRKPVYCAQHLDAHAAEAGLAPVEQSTEALGAIFRDGGEFVRYDVDGSTLRFAYRHPALDQVRNGIMRLDEGETIDQVRNHVTEEMARLHVAELVRNVALARMNDATLAQATYSTDLEILELRQQPVSIDEVAINVPLPILQGLPASELVAIREHEGAEFEAFRVALRSAIQERIARGDAEDIDSVAAQVYEDVIAPALTTMDRKLQGARSTLLQRSSLSVGVGAALTTVGLIAFAPVVVPGLVLALGGGVASGHDFIKDRKSVQMSDLHFLWRVSEKAGRHASGV